VKKKPVACAVNAEAKYFWAIQDDGRKRDHSVNTSPKLFQAINFSRATFTAGNGRGASAT
jgi:hypothetical protein